MTAEYSVFCAEPSNTCTSRDAADPSTAGFRFLFLVAFGEGRDDGSGSEYEAMVVSVLSG